MTVSQGTTPAHRRQNEERRALTAAASRSLLPHAAQPRRRRHDGQAVPPEQNRRRTLLQPRAGSGFGRHRVGAPEKGLACADDSQHRGSAGERRSAARYLHAAHGEVHFADAGQRRHEPFWRSRRSTHRFADFDARRPDSRDDRRRDGRPLPWAERSSR